MVEKGDQAEGQRFMTGCAFVLVAIGFIVAAFGLGIFTTYRQYKADPEEFEKNLKEDYRQMEEIAEKKALEEGATMEEKEIP